MPTKVDRPGGLIESPGAYLRNRTGRVYSLAESFRAETDFARLQRDFEDRGGRPCPNCTPAALVNALGAYRGRFPQLSGSPEEYYRLLRRHVRLLRSPIPGVGGYPAALNALLARRLWRLLGIDAWPVAFPFPSRKTLRREARAGEPLVLSVWSPAYRAHTVLLLGWELWTDGRLPRLFWVVRDGWRKEARYLDAEAACIWQAVRMAEQQRKVLPRR